MAGNLAIKRKWMADVLKSLRQVFGPMKHRLENPFELLVAAILSQHTSDVNSERAFERLEKTMGRMKPEVLAKMNEREIAKHIWCAGLARIKARRLRQVSKKIVEEFNGNLLKVLRRPREEARSLLLKLPGVGFKTADVVLAFSAEAPVIPIDTHLFTLAKRLGISDSRDYEEVRAVYEKLIPEGSRAEAHLLLLNLGKRYCIARNPKCFECPIRRLCPSGKSYHKL
ncbi:TPA: endonuclease III [Candidatus Bathyarchaeota archaeon]|nr:endonuclease III [Candidatus Bathyarchaeota archaeon]